MAHFTLSADGRIGAYSSIAFTSNIGRVAFDPRSGNVKGAVQAVTSGPSDFRSLDVSPDARLVVTASGSRRGREDLYIVPVDGGPIRQLTNDFARDRFPSWMDGGRRIVFQSDRGGAVQHLWSIDADGGGLRQLTKGQLRIGPLPSHDGAYVAATDLTHIFIYDTRDFSRPIEMLPPFPDPDVTNLGVSDWSPDGRLLVIGGPGVVGIWVYSRDEHTYRRLADTDGEAPVWLADGRRILYANRGRLRLLDAVSGASREVLAIPGESLNYPIVTRDNSQLFFTRGTSEGDIWLVRFGNTSDKPK